MLIERGRGKLNGVHPDLVKVVERAGTLFEGSFVVLEGARSAAKQKQNFAFEVLLCGVLRSSSFRPVSASLVGFFARTTTIVSDAAQVQRLL